MGRTGIVVGGSVKVPSLETSAENAVMRHVSAVELGGTPRR